METTWSLGITGGKYYLLLMVFFLLNVHPLPMTEPYDSSASCRLHLKVSSKVPTSRASPEPTLPSCVYIHMARTEGEAEWPTASSFLIDRSVSSTERAWPGSYLLNSLSAAVPGTGYSTYFILSSKCHLASWSSCHHQLHQCQAGIISSGMLILSFLFQPRPCCRIVIINAAYRPCARPFVSFF